MIELTQDQGQEIPEIKAGMSITVDPGVLTVSESGKAVVGVDNIRLVNAIPEHLEMSRVFAQECFHPLEKLLVPGASPGYVYVHTIGRIEEVGSYIRHRGQHIMLSDGKSNNQLKIIFTLNSLYVSHCKLNFYCVMFLQMLSSHILMFFFISTSSHRTWGL